MPLTTACRVSAPRVVRFGFFSLTHFPLSLTYGYLKDDDTKDRAKGRERELPVVTVQLLNAVITRKPNPSNFSLFVSLFLASFLSVSLLPWEVSFGSS